MAAKKKSLSTWERYEQRRRKALITFWFVIGLMIAIMIGFFIYLEM